MLERELKFHVPAPQRAALKTELRKLGATPIELHARYYDTPGQHLARAGIALRIRREGDTWVQTVKMPGPDEVSRIEWNHPRAEATLDLGVYAGTTLEKKLTDLADRLRCRYVTQVLRLKKVVATETGEAELAYDEGVIVANGTALPVTELEIEGISGETTDLFAFARDWVERHHLIIELRSKAERGDILASLGADDATDIRHGWDADAELEPGTKLKARRLSARDEQRLGAVIRAGQPVLASDTNIGTAYMECANDCMIQIIRNSGLLAGLDGMKTTQEQRIDYVHQIRVGIRRLRTCWSLFDNHAFPPKTLQNGLRRYFSELGQSRDLDVIQTELLPRLMQAGMPPDTTAAAPDLPAVPHASRALITATPEFQLTLLDLLEHLVLFGDSMARSGSGKRAAPLLCKRLNKWLDRIRHDVPAFLNANWDARHDMRKRVKRLRYGMEFAQGTLDAGRLTPLRNAIVSTQKALGQLNDLYVAAEYYRGAGARHPSAMFALGWLAATQSHEAQASNLALLGLTKAGRFAPAAVRSAKRKRSAG